jgi:HK97 gp10 family phage protein
MTDYVKCRVNLNGVEEELIALGPRIAKRLLRRSLRAVGQSMIDAIKPGVPVDSGALKDSITMKVRTNPREDAGSVIVGPEYTSLGSQDPGVYAMFVEFGVKSRPGYPVRPFMRNAFDSNAQKWILEFANKLQADLANAVKK